MNKKLLFKAFSRLIAGIIIVFILLFIPAGSFHYYNGWIFMGLLFTPMYGLASSLGLNVPMHFVDIEQ